MHLKLYILFYGYLCIIGFSQATSSHLPFNSYKLHSSHLQSSFNYAFFKDDIILKFIVSVYKFKCHLNHTQIYICSTILTTKSDILEGLGYGITKQSPTSLVKEARNNAELSGGRAIDEIALLADRKEKALNLCHKELVDQASTEKMSATVEQKAIIDSVTEEAYTTLIESRTALSEIVDNAVNLL